MPGTGAVAGFALQSAGAERRALVHAVRMLALEDRGARVARGHVVVALEAGVRPLLAVLLPRREGCLGFRRSARRVRRRCAGRRAGGGAGRPGRCRLGRRAGARHHAGEHEQHPKPAAECSHLGPSLRHGRRHGDDEMPDRQERTDRQRVLRDQIGLREVWPVGDDPTGFRGADAGQRHQLLAARAVEIHVVLDRRRTLLRADRGRRGSDRDMGGRRAGASVDRRRPARRGRRGDGRRCNHRRHHHPHQAQPHPCPSSCCRPGPATWRAEADVFFPRDPPFGFACAQRFFECITAMSAVRPVPWQTRQVSLTPSAALRGA